MERAKPTVFIQTADTASHTQAVTPGSGRKKKEKERPARPNSGQPRPLVAEQQGVVS